MVGDTGNSDNRAEVWYGGPTVVPSRENNVEPLTGVDGSSGPARTTGRQRSRLVRLGFPASSWNDRVPGGAIPYGAVGTALERRNGLPWGLRALKKVHFSYLRAWNSRRWQRDQARRLGGGPEGSAELRLALGWLLGRSRGASGAFGSNERSRSAGL